VQQTLHRDTETRGPVEGRAGGGRRWIAQAAPALGAAWCLVLAACGDGTGGDPACGNHVRESSEVCDGDDLDGHSCATLGLESGTLGCSPTCTSFDLSQCTGSGPGTDAGAGGAADAGSDGAPPAPGNASPVILSLSANTTTLRPGEVLVITAIVTDPDGIEDLIGGQLRGESGAAYGAFATAADEGAYELQLTWSALDTAEPIDAEPGGSPRVFEAVFYDVAGAQAVASLTISMRCHDDELALCAGSCVDWRFDADRCGRCDRVCPEASGLVGVYRSCVSGTCGFVTHLDAFQPQSCTEVCDEISGGTPMPVSCAQAGLSCVFSGASLPFGQRAGCVLYRNQHGWSEIVELALCASTPPLSVTSSQPGVGALPMAEQRCRCLEP
jgi:hypothetical protein